MKKTTTLFLNVLIAFMLFSLQMEAQSLQVLDTLGVNVSSTHQYISCDTSSSTLCIIYFDVKNISANTLSTVKVKKIEMQLVTGSKNTFCFAGQCYLASTYTSPLSVSIEPNGINETFDGQYKPKGHPGESIIKYVFFDVNNTTDTAFVIVHYNATATGIAPYENNVAVISEPYPNPASTQTSFNYSIPANSSAVFVLSDITGNKIKEIPIYNNSGVFEVPTNDLSNGLYFYSFYIDGKMQKTKKLIIKK